jgi:hypothetical protein
MNAAERRRSIEILVLLEKAYFQWYLPTAELFGKKTPCKKNAPLHPKQGNLLHRNTFTGVFIAYTK